MHRIIYRSHALFGEYTPAALDILATADRRNRQDGITGFLNREADRFVQIMEGPEPALGRLLERLVRDNRHSGMTILAVEGIRHRAFASWDMGYSSNHNVRLSKAVPEIWDQPPLSRRATDTLIAFLLDLAALKSQAA